LNKQHFEYGPVAQGIYRAMLYVVILIPFVFPKYFFHYVVFVLFIGLGLRPLLIKTGLYRLFQILQVKVSEIDSRQRQNSYYKYNAEKIDKREEHLKKMKKKMASSDNQL
jgi:hypothetical protein